MSTIERVISRLREAPGAAPSGQRNPVARVVSGTEGDSRSLKGEPSSLPSREIEFDTDALRTAGLFTGTNAKLADQYRMIKQPILKRAADDLEAVGARSNLIMVASSLSGEGKTFTCVNLGLSLATEKDWEVLLVDVDARNPQLSMLLGLENETGLLDGLRDRTSEIESFEVATNIPGLTVLPLGTRDAHAAELLASNRMKRACARLSEARPDRLVIFDSSPLLLTAEATILAAHVGQIVFVVYAGHTPQHVVVDAVEKLDSNKAIGFILNRSHESGRAGSYGSYGAYAYT